MAPYIGLALYTLFCWLLYSRRILGETSFLIMVIVPATLLLCFRGPSVGEDTAMYLQMAEASQYYTLDQLNPLGPSILWNPDFWGYGSSVDPGFLLILKACMALFHDPQIALALCAVVTCVCFAVFLRQNSKDIAQAYWGFLCSGLYMFAFNGVRQILAIGIAINFYQLAKQDKWFRAFLLILIGSCVHRSALVLLGILCLYYLLKYRRTYPIALAAVVFLPVLVTAAYPLVQLFSPQFASYYAVNYWTVDLGGSVLIWALTVACAIFLFYKRSAEGDSRFHSLCDATYVSLSITALRISVIERVALYALPFVCLSFDNVMHLCPQKNKWWVSLAINGLLFALFIAYAANPARDYVLCF